jgi:Chalcone isomerase-like
MRRGTAVDDGTAERWLQFMRRAFPDVQDGDTLTGQWLPATSTSRFASNGGPPAALQDAAFGPRFFGIWLSPQTPRPDMREQLLGMKSPR